MLRYLEIKERLKKEVSVMQPNEKLPSRPQLCRKLDTTRNTLDKAINELIAEGMLTAQNGSGTYVTEQNADQMAMKGSWGVIVPNIMESVYPSMVRGIENVAQKNGFTITLCNSDTSVKKQERYVSQLIRSGVAGIIIVPVITDHPRKMYELYEQLCKVQIPLVFCNRNVPKIDVPFVSSNSFYGGYLATRHLIGRQYKNIAYISRENYCTSLERCQGYLAALVESGLEINRDIIVLQGKGNGSHEEAGYMEMKRLLEEGHVMDAVFCFNDYVARGVAQAVKECGLTISDDIGIIGYDDEIFCEIMDPPMTSVSYQNMEIGQKAGELLRNMIQKREMPEFKYYLYEPEVVDRKSCLGPKATEPPPLEG